MQLEYKILFIDDDGFEGFMGKLKENLNIHLSDNGFVLYGIEIKSESELELQISKDINYDMIFVDNRFDDKECGIDFIKKIRDANIFADIILCTALSDSALVASIRENTAHHGFYYIRKGDDLFKQAHNIIDFRFNKELDTNVMRGIAMNEVAKFDNYIFNIIFKDDTYRQLIIETIKNKIETRYNDSKKPNTNEELWKKVTDPETSTIYFESGMRKQFLNTHVIKDIDLLKECYKLIRDRYKVDILDKRNILAHQIEPNLSEDEKKQFRKDLIKFRGIFNKINEYFNKESPNAQT